MGMSDELSRLQQQVDALSKRIEEGVPVQRTQAKADTAAPAAEKKAKPAARPAAPVTGNAAWQAALSALQKTAPSLTFPLKSVRLVQVKDNRFDLETETEVFVQIVNKSDNKAALIAALSEATGQPADFSIHVPHQQSASPGDTPKVLDELKATFGAENVRIQHIDPLP